VQVKWLRNKNLGLQTQLQEVIAELEALERRFEEYRREHPDADAKNSIHRLSVAG
jgi:RNase adaptor protein for sRNA GlmZ degradation